MFKLGKAVPVETFEKMVKDARMLKRTRKNDRKSETFGIFLAFVESEELLDLDFLSINDILDKV